MSRMDVYMVLYALYTCGNIIFHMNEHLRGGYVMGGGGGENRMDSGHYPVSTVVTRTVELITNFFH